MPLLTSILMHALLAGQSTPTNKTEVHAASQPDHWQRIETYTNQGSIVNSRSLQLTLFANGNLVRSVRYLYQDDAPPVTESKVTASKVNAISKELIKLRVYELNRAGPTLARVLAPPGSASGQVTVVYADRTVILDRHSTDQKQAALANQLLLVIKQKTGQTVEASELAADAL